MNIKRILIISLPVLALILCYFVTRSLTASLVILLAFVLYGAWITVFELGFWDPWTKEAVG
jgi:hypothetical protein